MSYIKEHLSDGEKIVFLSHRHWITVVPYPTLFFIGGGLAVWAATFEDFNLMKYAAYFLFGVGTLIALRHLILNSCAEFGVTNKRVVVKTGLVWRKTMELILQKIESIEVNQSILGRILGYGTITIVGSGGSSEPHANIAKPLQFRLMVQEQAQKMKDHD
ncbi:MAG: PH domain-containing protein [Phycisphaeraceae bacterium]